MTTITTTITMAEVWVAWAEWEWVVWAEWAEWGWVAWAASKPRHVFAESTRSECNESKTGLKALYC
jgi:hypothetical protein